VEKYKGRYGQTPDALAALGYDAAHVLADALKRAKSPKGSDLRDGIASTKDLLGVTGNITLGPDRNPINKKIVIEEVKNGQLTLRKTIDPGAAASGATAATGTPAATGTH
jgi:branched-chain amino acid transport system substrate-binding protein